MKKVVLASVISIVMLMTITAIYADCGASCDYASDYLDPGAPYCLCVEDLCAGGPSFAILYSCGRSPTGCDWPDRCREIGTDPNVELLSGGKPICYSLHEEAPTCYTAGDCDIYSFVDCFWQDEPICEC